MPVEETKKYYDKILDRVEDVMEMMTQPNYAYNFLKAKGIDRVIMPNLGADHVKLRGVLLMFLKVLFELLPTTTDAVIPVNAVDKLIDVFEDDDNLGMKAHTLDILYAWLPGNPTAQLRVMKMRGLEPFYRQIPKLNTSVIATMLELFNKILDEHIKAREEYKQRSIDSDKFIMYQRMGLIERVSTPTVCDGLLNIFYTTWSHTKGDVVPPVFHLIRTIKPYCVKVHKGKGKAIKFFEALLEHLDAKTTEMYSEDSNINITDIKALLQDYVTEIKNEIHVKDEF